MLHDSSSIVEPNHTKIDQRGGVGEDTPLYICSLIGIILTYTKVVNYFVQDCSHKLRYGESHNNNLFSYNYRSDNCPEVQVEELENETRLQQQQIKDLKTQLENEKKVREMLLIRLNDEQRAR